MSPSSQRAPVPRVAVVSLGLESLQVRNDRQPQPMQAKGFIDLELLPGFGSFDSPLGHHPDRALLPGVEIGSGSLGHGLGLGRA